MTKPSAPAQEWVVVPRAPTEAQHRVLDKHWHEAGEMRLAEYCNYRRRCEMDDDECYAALLAAAPDSGMVAVEANDLESVVILAMGRPSLSPLDEELLARLRALLSRAGNKGDGR